MKYVIRCKNCTYSCDTLEDAAAILNTEWDEFYEALEMEYADVGGGGLFWNVTEKVCQEWISRHADEAEFAYGSLQVPKLVRFHCQEDISQIEGEIEAEEDWLGDAVRDYRHSVGIQFSR